MAAGVAWGAGFGMSASSGRRTTNVLPWAGPSLRASTVASCISTSLFTSVRATRDGMYAGFLRPEAP
jgi:Mg2+/citrate symporter